MKKYYEYLKKYDELIKHKEVLSIPNIELTETEDKMFNDSKLTEDFKPSLEVQVVYETPLGRKNYSHKLLFLYDDLLKLIALSKQPVVKKKTKIQIEIEKLENEKEKLEQEKQEFITATQGHIYSNQVSKHIENDNIENFENLSITQKLDVLRQKYDNGEITYEEYQQKRKEIL